MLVGNAVRWSQNGSLVWNGTRYPFANRAEASVKSTIISHHFTWQLFHSPPAPIKRWSCEHGNSDRNILVGILAVQMDIIRPNELISAMHAWPTNHNRLNDGVGSHAGFAKRFNTTKRLFRYSWTRLNPPIPPGNRKLPVKKMVMRRTANPTNDWMCFATPFRTS